MIEINFVTSSKNKFKEAKKIMGFMKGIKIKQVKVDITEIQAMKPKAIVKDKAKKAYEKLKKPVIVEDTALYIKAWKNFPGPFIAWSVKTMGIGKMCKFIGEDRAAKAESYIAYYDGKRLKIFSGSVKGKIAEAPRGARRFDWDRIFIPSGFSSKFAEKTFAEMKIEEKNNISHRMRAFVKMKDYLESLAERKRKFLINDI